MAGRDRISADNSTLVVSPCLLSGSSVRGLFEMVSLSFCTAAKRTKLELNCRCIYMVLSLETNSCMAVMQCHGCLKFIHCVILQVRLMNASGNRRHHIMKFTDKQFRLLACYRTCTKLNYKKSFNQDKVLQCNSVFFIGCAGLQGSTAVHAVEAVVKCSFV